MKNLHTKIGISALSVLAVTGAAFALLPTIPSYADSSATTDVNLNVGAVMSLTLDANALDLNTYPNNFVSGVINATVSTNSQYGYTLTLEDADADSSLVHTNTDIDASLTSIFSGSQTSSEMEANTWGFSLNATDYFKVPINGNPAALKRTDAPMTAANETTPITFGAKVGNITSGTYTDKVLFTAYTNGQNGRPDVNPPVIPTEPGEDPAPNFQSFTCTLLENVGDSMVLEDIRDGNSYVVKKLQDGNCWMTQNLRIAGQTLDSYTSDLPDGVTYELPESRLVPGREMFWNLNESHVYVDPNPKWGGYYTFHAATAGWGTDQVYDEYTPQSICPKGWKLPTIDEYVDLYSLYNSAELIQGEPGFTLNGEVAGGTIMIRDEGTGPYGPAYHYNGMYWSGTSLINGTNASFFYIDNQFTTEDQINHVNGDSGKYPGFGVRCMSRR